MEETMKNTKTWKKSVFRQLVKPELWATAPLICSIWTSDERLQAKILPLIMEINKCPLNKVWHCKLTLKSFKVTPGAKHKRHEMTSFYKFERISASVEKPYYRVRV